MFKIRKAIKRFKGDFILEPNDTSVSRTTSPDDVSRYNAPLTRSLRNTANRDELPIIPVQPADSSNLNEAVSPLQKRNLIQSFQHSTSLVVEGGPSRQDPPKPLGNWTPIMGSPIPVNPLDNEVSKIALSNSSEKRTSFSSNSTSWTEYIPLPATPSKQVLSESLQQNSFIKKNLPPNLRHKEFETESALLTSQWQESKSTHYDTRPKSSVDFSMPSNASSSKTTNDNTVSNTPLAREIPEFLSNSTSLSSSEADDRLMESKQSSVTQTSQQSRESPYHNSVIQTTTPTAINDKDDSDQDTVGAKKRLDPTPITQPPPLARNKLLEKLNPVFKRENSVSGDLPLDGPSTSTSVQSLSAKSAMRTFPDGNPTSSKDNEVGNRVKARRKPSLASLNRFLLALAAPLAKPTVVSTEVRESDSVEQTKTSWNPKPFRLLQPIGEELGKIKRARSKANHEVTSQLNRTTATSEAELRPHIHQEECSSNAAALVRAAYVERERELQTQLGKALTELRDVRAKNKRLTNENQSQHYPILQLKIALSEVKYAQDHSSVQIKNQLRDATMSLTALNKEKKGWHKKGWQDKLDSMQYKLNIVERQVRCLDHLTHHKPESHQEAAYGQPKLLASVPASMDIIGAMGALNEGVFQTCIQLVEGLERTSIHSNRHKLQAQKVLGDHLTAMMEDHATMTTSDHNALLMQAVLEVFMVHWCSSIIQVSYPKQESLADLLARLSARAAGTSGSSAVCGKQIRIIQPKRGTPSSDDVKFNEWMTDILKELNFLLMIAGVKIKIHCFHLFCAKTLALVKAAYKLRIAMAEQDIHGGLEVVVVPPNTAFQENWMLDAHADLRKGDMDQSYGDVVAGTSGIGLQRKVLERVDGHFRSKMDMELKPKVILAQVLKVKATSQPSPTRPLSNKHGPYPYISEPLLSVHHSAGCDTCQQIDTDTNLCRFNTSPEGRSLKLAGNVTHFCTDLRD